MSMDSLEESARKIAANLGRIADALEKLASGEIHVNPSGPVGRGWTNAQGLRPTRVILPADDDPAGDDQPLPSADDEPAGDGIAP